MRLIFVICLSLLLLSQPIYAGEWITDTKSGCKVWNPEPVPNETITYSGECVDGKAHGKGSVTWYKDGKKNRDSNGQFQEGKLHGKASIIEYSNGKIVVRMETNVVNNKAHGKTIVKAYNPHGELYAQFEVEAKGDLLNGRGTNKIYENGKLVLLLEGYFNEKGAQGKGNRTEYKNGNKYIYYEGHFKDHFPRGDGSMIVYNDKGKKVVYFKGYFNANVEGNSIKNGKRIIYEDGKQTTQYEGTFKDFKPHGEGSEMDEDGNKYSGSWQNGKKHGKGKYTFPDGNSYKGLWENGERIKIF